MGDPLARRRTAARRAAGLAARRRQPAAAARRRGRLLRRADRQARLPVARPTSSWCARPTSSPTRPTWASSAPAAQPYITHPIAVAGLCADWKLDAQAIMAALMHDAMEDCGVTKAELIERFGAPTADLVDGLTKLDKLQFSTREESAGRVLPQDAAGDGARRARHPDQAGRPPAQHAHDGGDGARQAPAHRRARRWTSTPPSRTAWA